MIHVMDRVIRADRLKTLHAASSISLSIDDRGDFRMVRYKCSFRSADAVEAAALDHRQPLQALTRASSLDDWCDVEPLSSEGVLATFKLGGAVPTNTLLSHDADKSEKMADSVLEALKQTCSGPDGSYDEASFSEIASKVKHYASDQGAAALKAGHLLTQRPQLPKLVWASADPAHQVRIASKDPLHARDRFKAQWERLFSAKHALVPDIQNSTVWKSRLVACQQEVLRCGGQAPDVQKVLQTFSFAKQRFDSTSLPLLKYCCMLKAIALLCAMQATDDPWLETAPCFAPMMLFRSVAPKSFVRGRKLLWMT